MKFLYLTFITTFFISCNSIPKEYLTNNDICHYDNPIFIITKNEMTFDVEKYSKELEKGDLIMVNNKSVENKYHILSNQDIINYKTYKKLDIGKWIRYDKNGKIKSSTFMYLNGSSYISKETDYDQQGNIIKVIDYEKGYQICWIEAIEIIKKIARKDIEKYKATSFNLIRNDLNEFSNLRPEWDVSLNGNEEYEEKKYSKKGKKIYVIDGVTGKLIKIKAVRMVYDSMVE